MLPIPCVTVFLPSASIFPFIIPYYCQLLSRKREKRGERGREEEGDRESGRGRGDGRGRETNESLIQLNKPDPGGSMR